MSESECILVVSVKQRVPSWCDRVLWHVHKDAVYTDIQLSVELHRYTSVDDYVDSDHKPVIADCTVMASLTYSVCLSVCLFCLSQPLSVL